MDIDLAEAFAPGLRRGYIILMARDGETNDAQRVRVQRAIQRVCNSNVSLYQKDDDTPSRLWMAISQPPDRRKRAQLAAKTKRVILEQTEGTLDRIEVDFSTGSVWLDQVRVSGTSGPRPSLAVDAGPGSLNSSRSTKGPKTAWRC